MTKSFEVKWKAIERKIEDGFTYSELASEYKMDKKLKYLLESLND